VRRARTVVDSSVLLDVFTEDPRWLDWSERQLVEAAQRRRWSSTPSCWLIGAHAAVTGRPLLTRDPRRVAAYIPGATLIAPG
jgi:predicted nucleic acid-binding protein